MIHVSFLEPKVLRRFLYFFFFLNVCTLVLVYEHKDNLFAEVSSSAK